MHERKAEMARHADAFIALPGEYERKSTDRKICCLKQTYEVYLFCFRGIWNYGRNTGNDNMVTTWHP